MKRWLGFAVATVLMNAATAGSPLVTYKFEEGEQFNLALSSLNFNRIDVEGERIVKISFPEQAFIVELSKEEQGDVDGAVVLKPLAHIPLTVYFTTNRNHHFSATVTPSEDLGKTIRFVSKQLKGFEFVESKAQEKYQASDVMSAMMEGLLPPGYREVSIKPDSFRLRKHLKVTLLKQYQGSDSAGYVYRVENQSNQNIELTPSLFENPKLMTMELSERVLQPGQAAYFYGIYKQASVG